MCERTIRRLGEMDAKVYVYLASGEIRDQFMRDAEAEGYTLVGGAKPTERSADDVMAVNGDGTLNFVGSAGHLAFGSGVTQMGTKLLLRVDYAKYKDGEEDYIYVKEPLAKTEEPQEKGLLYEYFSSGKVRRMAVRWDDINGYAKYIGFEFYENGALRYAGVLQRGGLYQGRMYYPSGSLKFVGLYNERETGDYYGPPFPVEGQFFSESGELLYDGRFHIQHQGGVGYPKVVLPEGFGNLT